MSGVVLAANRDTCPVDPRVFAAMCKPLAHRAVDGQTIVSGPNWRLAFQSWWTTPEEVREFQPLQDRRAGACLAFDGRLDNREELAAALGLAGGDRLSDAAIALAAYERWREESFARFVGPFAVVVVEESGGRVVCARDHLGERTLVYAQPRGALVVASEECALLAHPGVSDRLSERTLARYLAVLPPGEGDTFFADIAELPPAHLLVSDQAGVRVRRYWEPDLSPFPVRSEGEAVEEWQARLRQAVRGCLRSTSPVAVLMSGGLDSTSVAALAAQEGSGRELPVAVSWVFDELAGADERRFMTPVVERYGLQWIPVRGDERWPLCPEVEWGTNPNGPGEAPSKALWVASAAALRERTCQVLLTGESGDHLYFGWEFWLRDLLRARRFAAAAASVGQAVRMGTAVDRQELRRLRSALARVVRPPRRRDGGDVVRPWLTQKAVALISGSRHIAAGGGGGDRTAGLRDPWNRWGLVEGYRYGRRLGLDVRRPYRDVRLATFAARMPSFLLYRAGRSKWIGRVAMEDALPEVVAWRRWRSSHLPFVARGLAERGLHVVREQLMAAGSRWSEYVNERAFLASFPGNLQRGKDGAETVVAWHCVCLELWRRRLGSHTMMVGDEGLGEERECA